MVEEERRTASLTKDIIALLGLQTHEYVEKKNHSIRLTKIFIHSIDFHWNM